MKWVKFGVSRPFWSCSVDFPHYNALLTETGHIWGIIWRMCGSKCQGKRRHISDALCRVLSSFTMFLSSYHYEIFRSYYHWQRGKGQRSKVKVKTLFGHFRTVTLVCHLTLQREPRQWTQSLLASSLDRRQGNHRQVAEIRILRVNLQLLKSK